MARKLIIALLLLLLVLMPHHNLVLWLLGEGPVRYWKEAAFLLAVGVYLLFVAVPHGWPRHVRWGVALTLPFVQVVLLRAGWGLSQGEDGRLVVLGAANLLMFIPAFLIAAQLVERPRNVERALSVVLVVTTLAGLLSIADWGFAISSRFGYFGRIRVQEASHYSATAIRSCLTFASPMVMGMFIGLGMMIAVYRASGTDQPARRRLVAAACAGVTLLGMFLTFSRGPLVSCTAGAAVILVFRNTGLRLTRVARHGGVLAYLLLLALYLGIASLWVMPDGWQQHVMSIADWGNDQNNSTRLARMIHGLEMIGERPFFGHGLGTAQARFLNYRIEELGYSYFYTTPESQFLLMLVEGGMALLGAYLLPIIALIAWCLWLARPERRPEVRGPGVLMLGVLVALLLESSIMPMLDTRTFKLLFWTMLGAALALRAYAEQPAPADARRPAGSAAPDRPADPERPPQPAPG